MKMRIQRILSDAGVTSRRTAEEWIRAGRVTVDGVRVTLGASADSTIDHICVDGVPLDQKSRPKVYLALNKPPGYTTSLKDRHAQHLISELIPRRFGRVFPVGRLDRDSEGLILLTNDGTLAHALTHPSSGIKKVYEVWVKGLPRKSHLQRIKHGIELSDGFTKPDEVNLIRKEAGRALMRITLHEGRNREIRRLFDSIGHEVEQLTRVKFGNISLQGIESGTLRPLTHREVRELQQLVRQGRERTERRNAIIHAPQAEHRSRYRIREDISAHQPRNSLSHARRNSHRAHR